MKPSSTAGESTVPPEGVPPLPDPLATPEAKAALGGAAVPLFRRPAKAAGAPPAVIQPRRRDTAAAPAPDAAPANADVFTTKPASEAASVRQKIATAQRAIRAAAAANAALRAAVVAAELDSDAYTIARLEGFNLLAGRDYAAAVLAAHEKAIIPRD